MARFSDNEKLNLHMVNAAAKQSGSTQIIASAPEGTSLGKIRQVAEKLQTIDPSLDFAAAVNRALLAYPNLYQAYCDETGKL